MRIKQGQWPESGGLSVKAEGVYREVAEGYTKIDGVWVPWDVGVDNGDRDLSTAMTTKNLDGLTLILNILG
ncbi:hypothetical protein D3C87_901260 [compost metagenome]